MPRRLGVLGTFVWDTIWHPGRGDERPLEQWGGIAYSMAAASAACPAGWEIEPFAKVGEDLLTEALRFVDDLANVGSREGLRRVAQPNNRVELRYFEPSERTERLTGGVVPWEAEELLEAIGELDALYVNMVSGLELDLEAATTLAARAAIPSYIDLHSLFLGPPGDGPREPRPLPEWENWASCFDVVQLNEQELALTGVGQPEELLRLEAFPSLRPAGIMITRGGRGATAVLRRGQGGALGWRVGSGGGRELMQLDVPTVGGPQRGDPTGCGDVWGAVLFAGLLEGRSPPESLRRAHVAAAAKLRAAGIDELPAEIARALATHAEE
ncbi:MAG: carbohydrate kinase family protein [Gemmatimonadota bacterium]